MPNFDSIRDPVERQILEAMARGEFDNLPGAGEPIDMDEWERTPPEYRMAYSILKNSKFVPPEVQLLKEIYEVREAIKKAGSESERQPLMKKLFELELRYNIRAGN